MRKCEIKEALGGNGTRDEIKDGPYFCQEIKSEYLGLICKSYGKRAQEIAGKRALTC